MFFFNRELFHTVENIPFLKYFNVDFKSLYNRALGTGNMWQRPTSRCISWSVNKTCGPLFNESSQVQALHIFVAKTGWLKISSIEILLEFLSVRYDPLHGGNSQFSDIRALAFKILYQRHHPLEYEQ